MYSYIIVSSNRLYIILISFLLTGILQQEELKKERVNFVLFIVCFSDVFFFFLFFYLAVNDGELATSSET